MEQRTIKQMLLQNFFEEYSCQCPTCRSKREKLNYKDLPEDERQAFKKLIELKRFGNKSTFLYCKRCNEYSIQSESFSSFNS